MKKLFAIILALILLLGLFAGCSKPEAEHSLPPIVAATVTEFPEPTTVQFFEFELVSATIPAWLDLGVDPNKSPNSWPEYDDFFDPYATIMRRVVDHVTAEPATPSFEVLTPDGDRFLTYDATAGFIELGYYLVYRGLIDAGWEDATTLRGREPYVYWLGQKTLPNWDDQSQKPDREWVLDLLESFESKDPVWTQTYDGVWIAWTDDLQHRILATDSWHMAHHLPVMVLDYSRDIAYASGMSLDTADPEKLYEEFISGKWDGSLGRCNETFFRVEDGELLSRKWQPNYSKHELMLDDAINYKWRSDWTPTGYGSTTVG